MQIYGVSFDMVGKQPIVLLKTVDGNRFLPIWIGHPEAAAILMKLQGASTPRPMTHDLLKRIIGDLDATVERIEVTDLKDNTYFALIYLQIGDREVTIDSRPSDAISLALRTKSPIWVAKKVLEASSVLQQMEEGKEQNLSNVSRDKWAEILEKMAPEDFKYKM